MKNQMTIKFVNYPLDENGQPITKNPDYLRIQGTVNRNGLVLNVSTLVYREPGAFETPEHEAGYRGLFGALERLAAFQEAGRDPDGSMAKGSVKTLEVPGNRGWMVVALGEVDRPDPKAIEQARVAAIAQPLSPAFGNELVEQFAAEAKRRVGVKINKDLVEQLRKELTGTAPVGE